MSLQQPSSLLEKAWNTLESVISSLIRTPKSITCCEASGVTRPPPVEEAWPFSSRKKQSETSKDAIDWGDLAVELALRVAVGLALTAAASWLARRITDNLLQDRDPDRPSADLVHQRLKRILHRRGQETVPPLNSYERQMAEDVLDPVDIDNAFADIGGLDDTKREIYELAILPLLQPDLFTGKLVQPCKGILLYGKPGTGKTMLAKALAKESQAIFLPLQLSKILNKWVGESNKLIAASFSLANKLQPAIIFIDELDTFLKASNQETQYLDAIKAEFLTLWDGVATASSSQVLVLGATNRPQTIDPAILRRMPRTFAVPLPNEEGRLAILRLLLQDEDVDDSVEQCLPHLARNTIGYSGSDLKELCKAAAMIRIQERTAEFAKERVMGTSAKNSSNEAVLSKERLRCMTATDLVMGLNKVHRTGADAQKYGRQEASEQQRQEASDMRIDENSLQGLTALLRALSNLSVDQGVGDAIPNI